MRYNEKHGQALRSLLIQDSTTLLFSFLPVDWKAEMTAGAQVTILDHETTHEGSRAARQQEPWCEHCGIPSSVADHLPQDFQVRQK